MAHSGGTRLLVGRAENCQVYTCAKRPTQLTKPDRAPQRASIRRLGARPCPSGFGRRITMNNGYMANEERPDELEARAIAERVLGVPLVHADVNGDVDYRFTTSDGQHGALEVTTVTDPKNKIARDQWEKSAPKYGPAPSLRQCWQVWINDRDVRYKGLLAALNPRWQSWSRRAAASNAVDCTSSSAHLGPSNARPESWLARG